MVAASNELTPVPGVELTPIEAPKVWEMWRDQKQQEQNDFTEKAIKAIYKRLDRVEKRLNDFEDIAPKDVKDRLENQIRAVNAYMARFQKVKADLENMLIRYELFNQEASKAAEEVINEFDSQPAPQGDQGELSQEGVSELGEGGASAEGA